MTASEMFELSRVYGMGWNAARTQLARGESLEEKQAAELSPYASDPEKSRWVQGFTDGLRGWRGRLPSASPFRGRR